MTSSPAACRVADCTVKSPRHRWYLDWTRRAQVNLPWPPPHTASVSSFLSRADPRQQRDTRSAAASEGHSALLCGHQRARLQPWRRYCGGSIAPPAHMGLLLSKEEARLQELDTLVDEAWEQYSGLLTAAVAEIAAGIPPVAGTNQALRAAARTYITQLSLEQRVVFKRKSASCPPQPLLGSWRAVVAVECLLAASAVGREDCCCCGGGGCVGRRPQRAGRPGHGAALPRQPAPRPSACRPVDSPPPRLTSTSPLPVSPPCCSRSPEGGG